MCCVKCKQSNSHTSLKSLRSHFILSYSNQAMTKTAHWWSYGHLICMGNLEEIFSHENIPEDCTETYKSSFFPYKQVSGRNGYHE